MKMKLQQQNTVGLLVIFLGLFFILGSPENEFPAITILGDNPVTVEQGSIYKDAGATAEDFQDGSIDIVTTGIELINTSVQATYFVTYIAIDKDNNKTKAKRKVIVKDHSAGADIEGSWWGECEKEDESTSAKYVLSFKEGIITAWSEYYNDLNCSNFSVGVKSFGKFSIGEAIISGSGLSGKEINIEVLDSGAGSVKIPEKNIFRINDNILYMGDFDGNFIKNRPNEFDLIHPFYKGKNYVPPTNPTKKATLSNQCEILGDSTRGSFKFPKNMPHMASYNYLSNNQKRFLPGFLALEVGSNDETWVCLNSGIPTNVNPSLPCRKDDGEIDGTNVITLIHVPSLLYCTYSYDVDLSATDVRINGAIY